MRRRYKVVVFFAANQLLMRLELVESTSHLDQETPGCGAATTYSEMLCKQQQQQQQQDGRGDEGGDLFVLYLEASDTVSVRRDVISPERRAGICSCVISVLKGLKAEILIATPNRFFCLKRKRKNLQKGK